MSNEMTASKIAYEIESQITKLLTENKDLVQKDDSLQKIIKRLLEISPEPLQNTEKKISEILPDLKIVREQIPQHFVDIQDELSYLSTFLKNTYKIDISAKETKQESSQSTENFSKKDDVPPIEMCIRDRKMAVTTKKGPKRNKQQEKRTRQTDKLNLQNRSKRSNLRTQIKRAKTTKNADEVNKAVKAIDSSLSKGLIKKNKAAREKSKLMKSTSAKK